MKLAIDKAGMYRFFIWPLAIIIVSVITCFVPQAGASLPRVCAEQGYQFQVRKNVLAKVGYMSANAPQGAVLYIQGPEESYKASRELLASLCTRGFSVVAFDLYGKNVRPKDYLSAAKSIRTRISKLKLKTVLYGWGEGAVTAAEFARREPRKFTRIILENPAAHSGSRRAFSALPRNRTRIFTCKTGPPGLKGLLLTAPPDAPCRPHLSAIPEAFNPLLEFIETDFSGVPASSWYWRARRA
jgi:pimeloyl-ACP methyl ester carboxylesterase